MYACRAGGAVDQLLYVRESVPGFFRQFWELSARTFRNVSRDPSLMMSQVTAHPLPTHHFFSCRSNADFWLFCFPATDGGGSGDVCSAGRHLLAGRLSHYRHSEPVGRSVLCVHLLLAHEHELSE
jgi:hypothetical protein